MSRFARAVSLVWLLIPVAAPLGAQETQSGGISIDQLQAVGSVVGGGNAPVWSPDGTRILFISSADGGLSTIPAAGGPVERITPRLPLSGVGSLGSVRPQYSPDGRHIAYVTDKGGTPELYLWDVAGATERKLTRLGARVNGVSFSPDSRTIAFAGDRYGSMDIWTVSVADGRTVRLTSDTRYEGYPSWTPDGGAIIYTRLDEDWVDHDVFQIPATGGASRLLLADKDYFDYRAGASFGFARVSPDGSTLLFRSQRSGWTNYWVAPVSGGAPRQIAAETADQSDARWSPDGKRILFLSMSNGTQSLKVVPASGGAATTLVAPNPGMVTRAEWSPDGTRISYTLGTPTSAADLYVIAAAGGAPTQLTAAAQGSPRPADLITPEKISWTSEGHTIHAYLYKPREIRAGQRLPVIMHVHGGPTGQFSDNYAIEPQFFASRGYVVIAPNVRGSSGYGKRFEDANNRDWGHGDLRDVVAGVEWAKQQPYVDRDRVGITGNSYGGMLTMYAISFAPGVFQAAISRSGYGDLTDFHTKVPELQHIKLLNYEMGKWPSTPQVAADYRRSSSIFRAKDATAPAMLIHGYGDPVPWRPARDDHYPALEFARELDKHYKTFRYKAYPNETYYVSGRANTKQMLQDMLAFFDQYLKDGASITPRTVADAASDN